MKKLINEIMEQIKAHDEPFFLHSDDGLFYHFMQVRDGDAKWLYSVHDKILHKHFGVMPQIHVAGVLYNDVFYTVNDAFIKANGEDIVNLWQVGAETYKAHVDELMEEYARSVIGKAQFKLTEFEEKGVKKLVKRDFILNQWGNQYPKFSQYYFTSFLSPDDAFNLLIHPELTREVFFKRFAVREDSIKKVKLQQKVYDSLYPTMTATPEEVGIAKALEKIPSATVTVVVHRNGKEASSKIRADCLLDCIYYSQALMHDDFTDHASKDGLFPKLGLVKYTDTIDISNDIVKIQYRKKAIWEK